VRISGPSANRHPRRLAAAAATIALAALAVSISAAAAYTPPRGTPDLAKMTLQASDFAPGAKPEGFYETPQPDINERAAYVTQIERATSTAGVKLVGIISGVELYASTASAQARFETVKALYGSPAGRKSLFTGSVPLSGKGSKATLKDARFGQLAGIGVGQDSLFESMTVAVGNWTQVADFVWLRIDAVVTGFTIIAVSRSLARSVPAGLAGAVAAHITAVLGAKG
jgi:hypothetical protein